MTNFNQRLFEGILWTNEIKTTIFELLVDMYFLQGLYEYSHIPFLQDPS
jgi:hypothetical protein